MSGMSRGRVIASFFATGLLAAFLALAPSPPAGAGGSATINVDTTDDEFNSDGDCSLREAIISANQNNDFDGCEAGQGNDTVMVPAGTYVLTIPDSGGNDPEEDDLDIHDDVTIVGAGASSTVIDADGIDRVFEVGTEGDLTVSFDGLTITGGVTSGDGGGIGADSTDLTVQNSVVTGNEAGADGGGIDSDDSGSSLTLVNSMISDNSADDEGGGFRQDNSETTVNVTDSTIDGNAARIGGGIHIDNESEVTITGSTISNNTATGDAQVESSEEAQPAQAELCGQGGGGYNQDWFPEEATAFTEITNSTISGNTADCEGGGLYVEADTTLVNVTVVDNGSPEGGNLFTNTDSPVSVELANTIVADPSEGDDCVAAGEPIVSLGGNLDSDGTCDLGEASDQTVADPVLGALANNGGSTQTHLPLEGSPAIDRALDSNCPADDQRDVARTQDGDDDGTAVCDVGAVEVVPTPDEPEPEPEPEAEAEQDEQAPAAEAVEAQPRFTG